MLVEEYSNTTGLPSVSTILDRYIYKKAFKDHHRERGSYVHQAVKSSIDGEFVVIEDARFEGYFRSFQQFKPRIKSTYFSEKRFIDSLKSYTGKLDFAGVIDLPGGEQSSLVDWKTSKSPSKTMPIALAAYRRLLADNSDIVIDRLVNVFLDENGGEPKIKVWQPEQYQSFEIIFRSAKQIYYYFGE